MRFFVSMSFSYGMFPHLEVMIIHCFGPSRYGPRFLSLPFNILRVNLLGCFLLRTSHVNVRIYICASSRLHNYETIHFGNDGHMRVQLGLMRVNCSPWYTRVGPECPLNPLKTCTVTTQKRLRINHSFNYFTPHKFKGLSIFWL